MKIAITGTTRGLGKHLYNVFKLDNDIITFNREDNFEEFVKKVEDTDLLINNSYLDGRQVELFDRTIDKIKRTIVIGSIAADNPDPRLAEYSKQKKLLQDKVDIYNKKILYLQLTGLGYQHPESIVECINLWLNNPSIKSINFYAYE